MNKFAIFMTNYHHGDKYFKNLCFSMNFDFLLFGLDFNRIFS